MTTQSMATRVDDLESSIGSIEKVMQKILQQMEKMIKQQVEVASKLNSIPSFEGEDAYGSSGRRIKGEGHDPNRFKAVREEQIGSLIKDAERKRGGAESSRSMASDSHKPEISSFNGNNPDLWILQAEKYFDLKCLNNEEKLQVSANSFEEDALRWFRWENHRRPFRRWEDLKGMILRQFRSIIRCSYGKPFATLKQGVAMERDNTEENWQWKEGENIESGKEGADAKERDQDRGRVGLVDEHLEKLLPPPPPTPPSLLSFQPSPTPLLSSILPPSRKTNTPEKGSDARIRSQNETEKVSFEPIWTKPSQCISIWPSQIPNSMSLTVYGSNQLGDDLQKLPPPPQPPPPPLSTPPSVSPQVPPLSPQTWSQAFPFPLVPPSSKGTISIGRVQSKDERAGKIDLNCLLTSMSNFTMLATRNRGRLGDNQEPPPPPLQPPDTVQRNVEFKAPINLTISPYQFLFIVLLSVENEKFREEVKLCQMGHLSRFQYVLNMQSPSCGYLVLRRLLWDDVHRKPPPPTLITLLLPPPWPSFLQGDIVEALNRVSEVEFNKKMETRIELMDGGGATDVGPEIEVHFNSIELINPKTIIVGITGEVVQDEQVSLNSIVGLSTLERMKLEGVVGQKVVVGIGNGELYCMCITLVEKLGFLIKMIGGYIFLGTVYGAVNVQSIGQEAIEQRQIIEISRGNALSGRFLEISLTSSTTLKRKGGMVVKRFEVFVGKVGEKKERDTIALKDTRANVEEEIVPSGGIVILASKEFNNFPTAILDQKIGVRIAQYALKVPAHTLAYNAVGTGATSIHGTIRTMKKGRDKQDENTYELQGITSRVQTIQQPIQDFVKRVLVGLMQQHEGWKTVWYKQSLHVGHSGELLPWGWINRDTWVKAYQCEAMDYRYGHKNQGIRHFWCKDKVDRFLETIVASIPFSIAAVYQFLFFSFPP